ncbi:MAG: hypothetical protein DPW09_36045 [Anaerolineae bacterium]|nr:hypothetical protein [Anaerolineae bacterium]MCQ3978866.1 hypothetical protein [Anaerolineae bacterium]
MFYPIGRRRFPGSDSHVVQARRLNRGQHVKEKNRRSSDWRRTGQHEEFGPVPLRQQVSYFASHEITHLPQMGVLRHQWVG